MVEYFKNAPYYDTTKDDLNKGYTTILAVPGRVEQAREFTEAQNMIYSHLQRIANTTLKNGSVIDGCSLIVNGTTAKITSGQVYIEGLVLDTPETELTITGQGSESIGVKLNTTVITEEDDKSLLDPAQGVDNSGQPGGHRIKNSVEFTLNDPNSPIIYTLTDGALVVEQKDAQYDFLKDELARRTYDQSGSFKVQGLVVSTRPDSQSLTDKIILQLGSGKAYIKGYEVTKLVTTPFTVDRSTEFSTARNELKRYMDGVLNYKLNNPSAKEIKRVTMDVYVEKTITRGPTAGGKDALADTQSSVVSILEVKDDGRTYEHGKDFTLDDNNSTINWDQPTGNEPSTGATYTVKYVATIDVDKKLYHLGTEEEGLTDYLVLSSDAPKPYIKENTSFTGIFKVEYDFYYVRRDLILMDKDGQVHVMKGRPDLLSLVETPANQDDNLLAVATVQIYPINGQVVIQNIREVRLTMEDLYRLAKRIDDLDTNMAITNLDREAKDGEDATRLTGILTDGLLNIKKVDVSHPDFEGAVDLDLNEFTVPTTQDVISLNISGDNVNTNIGQIGRVISAPFTSQLYMQQPFATEATLVNQYAVYNALALLSLDPAVDNWVDESTTVVNNTKTQTLVLRRWWYHGGSSWTESEKQKWINAGFADGGQSLGHNAGTGTVTTTTSTTDLDEAILYMRAREINVQGKNFVPNSDNLVGTFNNITVPLVPTGTTRAGGTDGTIMANADGAFTCKFTVPANVQTGTVEFKISNDNNQGSASYTANGRKRHVTESVLTVVTNVTPQDPLAQTFYINDRDTIIMQAGLFFAKKDSTKAVIVEVRNVINGYPGTTVYARQIIDADDVKVSDDATAETIVKFDQPVYAEQGQTYAIAVISDSNEYQMYTATLGKSRLGSSVIQGTNPYADGVLFSSSNAQAWTAHQDADLMFKLYNAVYNPAGGQIVFDDVTGDTINRILVATDYIDKKNAGITWKYSVDGLNWIDIDNFVDRDLAETTSKISLMATVKVINNSSPLLAGDSINLVTFLDGLEATYVSRNVIVDSPYTKVKVTIDSNYQVDPAISELNVYYADDIDGKVWRELTNPVVTTADSEFNRFEYSVDNLPEKKNYRVKIHIKTTSVLSRPRVKRIMNIMTY